MKVTCAEISSNRAAVCACMRRVMGVAFWGARSSSFPGYLRRSASSCVWFLMFSSVRPGPAPPFVSLSSVSLPLFRSGRGLGLCLLLPLPGDGLAAWRGTKRRTAICKHRFPALRPLKCCLWLRGSSLNSGVEFAVTRLGRTNSSPLPVLSGRAFTPRCAFTLPGPGPGPGRAVAGTWAREEGGARESIS